MQRAQLRAGMHSVQSDYYLPKERGIYALIQRRWARVLRQISAEEIPTWALGPRAHLYAHPPDPGGAREKTHRFPRPPHHVPHLHVKGLRQHGALPNLPPQRVDQRVCLPCWISQPGGKHARPSAWDIRTELRLIPKGDKADLQEYSIDSAV